MEACDVSKRGRHLGHHLGFYQELKKRSKRRELKLKVLFFILCMLCFTKSLKQVQNNMHFHSKWLDHLLFMTSYLVTIVTDHHSMRES